eukprot:GHVU01209495.1.p1 GENE.GHVU01209495.1~~GHVU01209495.1.p1  ORF type:complete len:335 (+),score=68.13 GHVU01209495.1:1283-2287(+)
MKLSPQELVASLAGKLTTTNFTNEDFPIDLKRKYNCEVCQLTAHILSKELAQARSKQRSRHQFGELDLDIQSMLDSAQTCTYSKMKDLADKTEFYHVYDLTASCKVLLSQEEELLEEILENPKTTPEQLREKMCLGSKLCLIGDLWKKGDIVDERPTKLERNKQMSEDFFKKLDEDKNITKLESGLRYKVIHRGNGTVSPTIHDTVDINYNGTLINGKSFDSNYHRSHLPATLGVGQVIQGWQQGLPLMKEGDDFIFYIPSELGYGPSGGGREIAGNMALIFRVQLIKVIKNADKGAEDDESSGKLDGSSGALDGSDGFGGLDPELLKQMKEEL